VVGIRPKPLYHGIAPYGDLQTICLDRKTFEGKTVADILPDPKCGAFPSLSPLGPLTSIPSDAEIVVPRLEKKCFRKPLITRKIGRKVDHAL
jgi:hypothetical protein